MDMHNFVKDSLGRLAYQAYRAMANAISQTFRDNKLDLTLEQWRVLVVLFLHEGLTQQEIATILDQEKTGVSRLLNGLEKKNYVVRVKDQLDARCRRLYISNKTKTMMPVFVDFVRQTSVRATEDIDPEELAICKKVLEQVIRNLG